MFLVANGRSGSPALNQKRRQLLLARAPVLACAGRALGEDRVEVRDAAVGDPHLLAVQRIGCAIRGEHRPRARVQRVGARRRLRQRVRADPLAGPQPGQVLLFLLRRPVPDDRQRTNARMGRERHRETSLPAHVLRHNGRAHLVHLHPAILLGNIHGQQAQLARLLHQPPRHREVLRLNRLAGRHHLIRRKIRRRLQNLRMFLREVLGKKAVARRRIVDKKCSAGHALLGGSK